MNAFISHVDVPSDATTNGIIACWADASPYKGLLRCKQMRNAYHVCTRHAFAFPLSTLQHRFDVASELLSVIFLNYSQREKVDRNHFQNGIT